MAASMFKQMGDLMSLAINEDFRGGASLMVVHPPDLLNQIGNYGHIASSLAGYGEFQYGTSINAPVYKPFLAPDGCTDFADDH